MYNVTSVKEANAIIGALEDIKNAIPPANPVPDVTSADNGKVLKATYSGGEGSYDWENESGGVPSTVGHNLNEVLVIDDTTINPPTADWYSLDEVLPQMNENNYPSNGDVIAYNSSTNKAEWQTPQGGGSGLPDITSSDNGKVLQAYYDDKSGSGYAEWGTPSGGGGLVSTTFTVNASDFVQDGSSYKVVFDSNGEYQGDMGLVISSRIYYSGMCSIPCSIIYIDKTGWIARVSADDYTYIRMTSGLTLKIFAQN